MSTNFCDGRIDNWTNRSNENNVSLQMCKQNTRKTCLKERPYLAPNSGQFSYLVRIWFFHRIQLDSNMRIGAETARESDLTPFLFMIQNSEKKTYLKKKYHWYNPRTSEYNILNIMMVNCYVPYRWQWSVDCCVVSYVLVVTLYRPVRLFSSIKFIINHYICQFLFVLD